MPDIKEVNKDGLVRELFKLGAHFGYSRARRHPSTKDYIFGFKNKTAIIDLEKTTVSLETAKDFLQSVGREGGQLILVGTKNEAKETVTSLGQSQDLPYVAVRWIGGTLTNFGQVKKRLARLAALRTERETNGLSQHSKKEQGRMLKELESLERYFGSLVKVVEKPGALLVVDPGSEAIAVAEAKKVGVPVIALANSDSDLREIDYPIVVNDTSRPSINFLLTDLVKAYAAGQKLFAEAAAAKAEETKVSEVTA